MIISNLKVRIFLVAISVLVGLASHVVLADTPSASIDIATLSTNTNNFLRVSGSVGDGHFGVPVAGGYDVNNDGFLDYMFAAMRASPLERTHAGQVHLIFGDGTVNGSVDTSQNNARTINIFGDGEQETTGSEVWMDDVTGDGLGDLLIGRQNFDPGSRPGAGALTIISGADQFRSLVSANNRIDLRNPPAGLAIFTITGAEAGDRLGVWMRSGDVDGDGISDLVIAADQDDGINNAEEHSGSLYVIRGGAHLNSTKTIDLANFGNTQLSGNIAQLLPPIGSAEFHFGGTCQIADLDGNGRAEVMGAAALSRIGASIPPLEGGGPTHAGGGEFGGTLFIAWDNIFPAAPWPAAMQHRFGDNPALETRINGGPDNFAFGEEILGGLDYNNDQLADLFVGDLNGFGTVHAGSGIGNVFYQAAKLKGLNIDMEAPPTSLEITRFDGPELGAIAADTAMHGDFNGDGIADLAFSSPHGTALGRPFAGIIHVFQGRNGLWPKNIDLRPGMLPPASQVHITEVYGARGNMENDSADNLSYSGAAGDIDGDGRDDIITNEMVGNGLAEGTIDVGNLIIISGKLLGEQSTPQPPLVNEFEVGGFSVDHNPQTIATQSYNNPLLILGPPTKHGANPGVAAITIVETNRFRAVFKEWDYRFRNFADDAHTQEQVSYLIGEPGRIEFADGSIWEMGQFDLSGTRQWAEQSFQASFPAQPALFLSAQSMNDSDVFSLKARSVTSSGFEASINEEEFLNNGHGLESIAYLAMYSPRGSGTITLNGQQVRYLLQNADINHQFSKFASTKLQLEEEQSNDAEVGHTTETVNSLNLGPQFFSQIISDNGADTVALRKQTPEFTGLIEWGTLHAVDHTVTEVPLFKQFSDPIVIIGPASFTGAQPGEMRAFNIDSQGFSAAFKEWDYLDRSHVQESVDYLVVEAGQQQIGGLNMEAGRVVSDTLATTGQFEQIGFNQSFSNPSVFSALQSMNSADAVKTRSANLSSQGFATALEKQQSNNTVDAEEIIGWVAIETGIANTSDQRNFQVFRESANHQPSGINLPQVTIDKPATIINIDTFTGPDTVSVRLLEAAKDFVRVFLQEETSADPETVHVTESISIFAGD